MLYGAILGDIIGSAYEFDNGNKSRVFPLFSPASTFTDDTVMTIAIAQAAIKWKKESLRPDEFKEAVIDSMKKWGKLYPDAGYGFRFFSWVLGEDRKPYNSWGNGAAMRVSPCAYMDNHSGNIKDFAEISAAVTHNHPEGIKAARAEAEMIYEAKQHKSKEELREIAEHYYGKLKTLDEIRPTYKHREDCMHTMPEAFECFLESNDFESCIRNVMYIGGDTDTLGAIARAIAEAYYGIPEELIGKCRNRLPQAMLDVIDEFEELFKDNK